MGAIACLPMYDFPWTASANDDLWENLSARLRKAGFKPPAELTRAKPLSELWRNPKLLFGQTCGYPYWRGLRERVRLIATPVYAFDGCEGGSHGSFIVARKDDRRKDLRAFRGARAALNGSDSNTGMNLFRATLAPLARRRPFFSQVFVTGAHAESLAEVAEGRAQIAAIDCVSFALLARGRPDLTERVKIVARTPMTPGLPFIASAAFDEAKIELIRRCLRETLADPALKATLAILGLVGVQVLDEGAYARVGELEDAALALGYRELA